eukprot:PhM_4_TR5373/c0_g1_i1/m.85451
MASSSSLRIVRVGDFHRLTRSFSLSDIKAFSALSYDANPLHFEEDAAKKLGFDGIVVPGLLTSSTLSGILANHVPGPGSIYMNQDLKFCAPVYTNDELEFEVKITKVRKSYFNASTKVWVIKRSREGVVLPEPLLCIDGEAVGKNTR